MASEPTTDPSDERSAAEASNGGDSADSTPPQESAAPKKRAARKRAPSTRSRTKAPAADPAPEPSVVDDPSAGEAGDEPVAEEQIDSSESEEQTPLSDPGSEATDSSEAEIEAKIVEADQVEAGAEDADFAAPPADDSEDAHSAEVPSFGLLFQAPEPVAPRRRRATAAAGAPSSVRAVPEADSDVASEQTEDDASDMGADERRSPDARSDDSDTDRPRRTDDEPGADSEDGEPGGGRRSRRRGGRGRRSRGGEQSSADTEEGSEQEQTPEASKPSRGRRRTKDGDVAASEAPEPAASAAGQDGPANDDDDDDGDGTSSRRRRRRRRGGSEGESEESRGARARDEVTGLKGSTRLEAKKQRRREGREAGRRRTIITEAEFLARRESVERVMVVRERDDTTQIGVLEDGVLVEHYVSRETGASMIGNVYLGRVQNVLPSMEAAFVDIGKGRNAVLYAGEVNWDAAGLEGNGPRRIENALSSGDTVLVQVTKDPIGHKGARLTSQISLPGRFLVYVPEASMTGISRKLPDTERSRLKSILKKIVPDDAGVIVRTASEGASEEELTADIKRLTKAWEKIQTKADRSGKKKGAASAPVLLHGEPDLTVKVIRDVFNEDFSSLLVAGDTAWAEVSEYLEDVAPELAKRLSKWTQEGDLFTHYRVDEQIAKALDRKVWLPSGGSLVIDRTEAMTVVDVNTGKFVGSGGNLEETVTKNNIEAAEEIVRQLRLRDIGGIIVIDFIDMVLESNRDLIVRRLLECLGRDRTKHQVAEVTSLGLVQMTRKRVGSGLLEVFSEPCAQCAGRGVIVHTDPQDAPAIEDGGNGGRGRGRGRGQGAGNGGTGSQAGGGKGGRGESGGGDRPAPSGPTAAQIAAAAHAAALKVTTQSAVDEDEQVTRPDLAAAAESGSSEHSSVSETPESAQDQQGALNGAQDQPVPETAQTGVPEPESTEPAAPTQRPRRKRGRVIAAAGPPGRSEVTVLAGDGA